MGPWIVASRFKFLVGVLIMQVKYFKDADGEIHGLINEVQDHLIKEDFVPLTKNELDRLFFQKSI